MDIVAQAPSQGTRKCRTTLLHRALSRVKDDLQSWLGLTGVTHLSAVDQVDEAGCVFTHLSISRYESWVESTALAAPARQCDVDPIQPPRPHPPHLLAAHPANARTSFDAPLTCRRGLFTSLRGNGKLVHYKQPWNPRPIKRRCGRYPTPQPRRQLQHHLGGIGGVQHSSVVSLLYCVSCCSTSSSPRRKP